MKNIVFSRNICTELNKALAPYTAGQIYVLADTHTQEYCLPLIKCEKVLPEQLIVVPEGEAHKTLESAEHIWKVLSSQGAKRSSVLVNVGGGLVTDLGGFAASCFKRGMSCINVPTTLLSQVDASVGGKTGINFNGLKNEIGTFSIPEKVIIDPVFLRTLPLRQLLSGFAEMLKHALLAGGEHFERIMRVDPEQVDWEKFGNLIWKSVEIKYAIVENDPQEKRLRKALNFGHTVGHALESAALRTGAEVYHGDAVAYGMIAELYLSVQRRDFPPALYERIRAFIEKYYPPYLTCASDEEIYALMLHDKKNEGEGVNFTLLSAPGVFRIDNYCTKEEIMQVLKELNRSRG